MLLRYIFSTRDGSKSKEALTPTHSEKIVVAGDSIQGTNRSIFGEQSLAQLSQAVRSLTSGKSIRCSVSNQKIGV